MSDTRKMRLIAGVMFGLSLGGFACPAGAQTKAQLDALQRLADAAHPSASILRARAEVTSGSGVNPLSQPSGLAYDVPGNLFIADTNDHIILEVSLAGVISTVAGNKNEGFSGDGGAATSASLDSPMGIAIDGSENIYIADTRNNRIREVTAAGIISTLAGTGTAGFSGDGGPAKAANLASPTSVALDSKGNVYIADRNNHRIRKISGTTISTVAGSGDENFAGDGGPAILAGLDSPYGVAVDASFNLYVSDTRNDRIRMVTASTGIITTLAGTGQNGFSGDGSADSQSLARPKSVAVDTSGNVYIADSDNQRIRKITPSPTGATIATIAGDGTEGNPANGSATSSSLNSPAAVAVHGTAVAIANTDDQTINVVIGGKITTTVGTPPSSGEFLSLTGLPTYGYGTGNVNVAFGNGSNTATGKVTFYDVANGNAVLGSVPLAGNTASLSIAHLSAGAHSISAVYGGDANDAAITSGGFPVTITPAAITATLQNANFFYGQFISVNGTITGVVPQDIGAVSAAFTTAAAYGSPAGNYPVTVTLSGSAIANYTVTLAPNSASVVIAPATTLITLAASRVTVASGAPLTLTANVADSTSGSTGTPTGVVNFYDAGVLLNPAPIAIAGAGNAVLTSSFAAGTHSFTASYSGSGNFNASTSPVLTESVVSTDYTVAATPTSQTVQAGALASYSIALTPANQTFLNGLTLSVSGLPSGATAAFSPASIAAGTGAVTTILTIKTAASTASLGHGMTLASGATIALGALLFPFARRKRLGERSANLLLLGIVLAVGLAGMGMLSGCGGGSGTMTTQPPAASYSINILCTPSGGNGTAAPKTITVNLTIQ